jgi:DNA-directed RNA polymerase specialized sigma subunit
MERLIIQFTPMVKSIIRKRGVPDYLYEDALSEGFLAIIEGYNTYNELDSEKRPLECHFYASIDNSIRRFVRREKFEESLKHGEEPLVEREFIEKKLEDVVNLVNTMKRVKNKSKVIARVVSNLYL